VKPFSNRALRDLETGNRKRPGCGNFCVLIEHSNTGEQYRGVMENDETVQRAGNRRLLRRSDTRVLFEFRYIGNKSRRSNIVLTMKLRCSVQSQIATFESARNR